MSVKFPSGGMNDRTRSDSQRLNRTHGWKLTSSRSRGFCHQQREVLKKQSKALTVKHKRLRGSYPTIKDIVRSGIPLSFTQASITPWISADTVVPGKGGATNLTYETLHEEKGLQNIQQYTIIICADQISVSLYRICPQWRLFLLSHQNTPHYWRIWHQPASMGCLTADLVATFLQHYYLLKKKQKPRWSHKCTH